MALSISPDVNLTFKEQFHPNGDVYRVAVSPEAARHNEGKPEMGYVLDFPKAVQAVVAVMEYGAGKYTRDNWKKGGKPDSEYVDACLRHLYAWKNGKVDPESGCRHLAHAVWNLMVLMELNDG